MRELRVQRGTGHAGTDGIWDIHFGIHRPQFLIGKLSAVFLDCARGLNKKAMQTAAGGSLQPVEID